MAKNRLDKILDKFSNGKTETPATSTNYVSKPRKEIPIESWPPHFREFCEHGAKALNCSLSFVATPALSVVASCIGNTRQIQLKRKYTQPAVLWTAIVGKSGSTKTPAYSLPMGVLTSEQFSWIEDYHEAMESYQEELQAWLQQEKQSHKSDEPLPPRPKPPIAKRILTNDSTVEKLISLLQENPRGLLVARNELAGWLTSFSRYNKSSDLQVWLELFDGCGFIVDRKNSENSIRSVERASVSIVGGIQPGILARYLTPEYLEAGLGARILLAYPEEQPHYWTEVEIQPEVERRWNDLILTILEFIDFDQDLTGKCCPITLPLSKNAKKLWIEWYNRWETKRVATTDDFCKAAFAKIPNQCARLALIHHVTLSVANYMMRIDYADREIQPESIKAGIDLAEWFAEEAARIYGEASRENSLHSWIAKRGGYCTVRDLVRSKKATDANQGKAMLDELVYTELGQWRTIGKKEIFYLNSSK